MSVCWCHLLRVEPFNIRSQLGNETSKFHFLRHAGSYSDEGILGMGNYNFPMKLYHWVEGLNKSIMGFESTYFEFVCPSYTCFLVLR
jgi:hypothetical protein